MTTSSSPIAPVASGQRIVVLDVLRGFALLGILIMNIQFFAMPEPAYHIPTTYGDLSGANRWVWILSHIFADQKFMTIFAMLYGAGIVLITGKVERTGKRSLGLHYRRSFWLLVIGLVHAYLIWAGDILVLYALCAFLVYWFRRLAPRWQLVLGLVIIGIGSAFALLGSWSLQYAPPETVHEVMGQWQPQPEELAAEIAAYQGSWLEQMAERIPMARAMQTEFFLTWGLWRAGGLMIVGMALYQWGVLTGKRTRRFYIWLTAIGLGIGIPVVAYGVWQNFAHDWDVLYARLGMGYQANHWASILVSLGYVGAVTLYVLSNRLRALQNALAAVGRTALTNYILQSLLATLIFYGHGLGLFGTVERTGQVVAMVLIWAVQLVISPLWLRHFRFGPLEWLWRSLTYWRIQPFRVRPTQVEPDLGAS